MKKLSLFALLAILIVSLAPVAFAQDADTTDAGMDDTSDAQETTARSNGNVNAQMRVKQASVRTDKMSERAQLKYVAARDRYQQARTLAAHARDRAQLAKEHLKEFRSQLAEDKRTLAACRGQDTEDCATKRTEAKGDAINVLTTATDRVLAMLETAKERATDAGDEELVAKLDAQIAEINDAKSNVDALGDDSSTTDVRESAKKLRDSLGGSKAALKDSANKLVGKRLGVVVGKSRQLVNRIDKAVAKLEARGADVSGIDVDGLKAKVQEAVDMHNAGNYREALAALKEVHTLLRDAVKGIKSVQGGSDAIEESGDDADANHDAEEAGDDAADAGDDGTEEAGDDAEKADDDADATGDDADTSEEGTDDTAAESDGNQSDDGAGDSNDTSDETTNE